jgi:hypothetical protein
MTLDELPRPGPSQISTSAKNTKNPPSIFRTPESHMPFASAARGPKSREPQENSSARAAPPSAVPPAAPLTAPSRL